MPSTGLLLVRKSRKQNHIELYQRDKIFRIKECKNLVPGAKDIIWKVLSYTKAVDDVTFDVYEGETLGLVGESGCGKTTLGRTILKLTEASEGQIFYKREELLRMKEADFRPHRKDMQIIFQDPYSSLNPRITVGDAIMEPMKIHNIFPTSKQRRDKVYDLLKKVGLDEKHYHRYPHEFSGGQRQRICIARAFGLKP